MSQQQLAYSSAESELIELDENTRFTHDPPTPVRTYFEETIIYKPDKAHITLLKKRSCWHYCCAFLCCRFGLLYDSDTEIEPSFNPTDAFMPTQVYN